MVKGKKDKHIDDKIRRIEEEVDRLIKERGGAGEAKEEYIKPEQIPESPTLPELGTEKRRIFKKTGFPRQRIVKPVAVILVISMILTGIQLLSLISTGETVIVPSDFGIPEEFENAKQEFETESINATQKAEELLGQADWNHTPFQAGEISYETVNVNKTNPEWASIFGEVAGNISYNIDRKYYVFTYYQGKTVITEGDAGIDPKLADKILDSLEGNLILKSLIENAMANWRYIWVPIDVDNDDSTDIEVTLNLKGSLEDIQLVDLEDIIVTLIGGLEIRVNKTENLSAPLDMYFIKGISYEGKSYVLIFRFYFSSVPQNFCFFMNSDNISGKLRDKTPIEVKPPYTLNWTMSEDIANFDIGVGYAKLDSIITQWTDDFTSGNLSEEPYSEVTWTHTTNEDFEENCYSKDNVIFTNGEIRLDKNWLDGEYISKPQLVGENAILKSVTWDTDTPLRTSVWIKDSENSIWLPATASITEVVQGESFQYKIVLWQGLDTNLKEITLTVAKGGAKVDTSGGTLKLATFTANIGSNSINFYYPHGTFISKVWDANGYNILENVCPTSPCERACSGAAV
ncbi:MAG: hypothetical protein QMC80_08205, partial [Thermoplasmatales archaeon]|nr:hypothetical protein [Thermoplasmatales archaeon]